jgi:integrase
MIAMIFAAGSPEPVTKITEASMRIKITPAFVQKAAHIVDEAKPGRDRTLYWDASLRCFGLQVTASGERRWVLQYRAGRRSRRMAIGDVSHMTVEAARREAKKLLGRVAGGADPLAEKRQAACAKVDTFFSISEEFLTREEKRGLRSVKQYRAIVARLLVPKLGTLQIGDIRKSDITRLLDQIEDERGPTMARQALATLRRILNWHASRSDDFLSPIVRMGREAIPSRDRTLSDDELRAIWKAAEASGTAFGALVRFLLLTAVRRTEAAGMCRDEVADGVWTVPAIRSKSKRDHLVPLTAQAQAVLAEMPMIGDRFVFTSSGRHAINNFSAYKSAFDKSCGVTGWTIHDLRRTARSLMSRAGVNPDIAERCLGHVIGGVRGTYDRHSFAAEKRRALEALASQIETILNPHSDNVVSLHS